MTSTSSYRTRRRAHGAYEPASNVKDETKDPSFFGPSRADPFFAGVVQRAMQNEDERVKARLSERQKEEEESEPQLDIARQEEGLRKDEEEGQPKLEIAREEDKEEEEGQPKLEIAREEQQDEEELHAKRTDSGDSKPADPQMASYVNDLKGRGRPMSTEDQEWFGLRMGHGFSQVQIHTGRDAEASAKALRAKAYTYGNHIVFGPGQYRPESHAGRTLMAHELAHVLQQRQKHRSSTTKASLQRAAQAEDTETPPHLMDIPKDSPVPGVICKRNPISVKGDDKYGHWWLEMGSESYGWWPKYRLGESGSKAKGLWKTLTGVPGELNGTTTYGGSRTRDPKHGTNAAEKFSPVSTEKTTLGAVVSGIRSFVRAFKGMWRWTFGWGQNCRTLQERLMKKIGLKKPS